MSELRDAVHRFREGVEPRREVVPGWLVDHEGIGSAEVTDEPGFVYVLLDRGEGTHSGDTVKARGRIRPVSGWPVLVGTTRERPWEYMVLDLDYDAMGSELDGKPTIERHHETHEWDNPDGGDDTVFPRWEQLYNFSVWPGDGLTVDVASGVYNPSGTKLAWAYTNVNLSGTRPTTGQRYVLVCLSPTGTIELVPGTVKTFLELSDIPQAPSSSHWELAAVRIKSIDTQIVHTPYNKNIVDLRLARVGYPALAVCGPSGTCAPSGTFLGLEDTPSSYFGHAGDAPLVNAIENALEFVDVATQAELDVFIADVERRRDAFLDPLDHFEGDSLDAAWGWAGAPFVTPGTVTVANSLLQVGNFTLAADRAFLYRALPSFDYISAALGLLSFSAGFAGGVRLDDGSDNNYAEVVVYLQTAIPAVWRIQGRFRAGGGGVVTADGNDLVAPLAYIADMQVFGTKWTNWSVYPRMLVEWSIGAEMYATTGASGRTWTPTRIGLIFDQGGVSTASWNLVKVDFYDHRTI